MTTPSIGSVLLKGRYELVDDPVAGAGKSQIWKGFNSGYDFLVKTWRYEGDQPDPVQRALWDQELRTLYKVASSPRSEESLVLLKDAGLDPDYQCFVMVLEAVGYDRLAEALQRRPAHSWLSDRGASARREIWGGLGRIATGLNLLHERQVLHRGVDVDSVYFDQDQGPESFRLGGFEWSVKLGRPVGSKPPHGWPMPPERVAGSLTTWRPDDDWFAFGILCARVLLDIERFGGNPPKERYERTVKAVQTSSQHLSDAERKFILDLIAADPLERQTLSFDILARIQEIVSSLGHPKLTSPDNVQHILALDLRNADFIDHLLENGLREHMKFGVTDTFIPLDPRHRSEACEFIRQDMRNASVYAVPGQKYYILVGGRLSLKVTRYRTRDGQLTWQVADCRSALSLRYSEDDDSYRDLPVGSVFAYSRDQLARDRTIIQNSSTWEPVLPKADRSAIVSRELARLHEFLRASNQIELLLLDSQIFPYELVNGPWIEENEERIVVRERARPEGHEQLNSFDISLIDFLQREVRGSDKSKFILTPARDGDRLKLPRKDRNTVDVDDSWQVEHFEPHTHEIRLVRAAIGENRSRPEPLGFLRSAGMPGQISLFQRRKKAIDALDQHGYLLRSLINPGMVRMDTGVSELPVPLDHKLVDEPKRASIEDILRVRPIYTLQGPPGTGKTTLVAWLLREIVAEDPVVQVLVTAQAHGAVDVLRSKVGEAFRDVPEDQRPLEVRLRSVHKADEDAKDGAKGVAKQVLERSILHLKGLKDPTVVQSDWLADAQAMWAEMDQINGTTDLGRRSADFVELVKRGANLTYCTTSAGDLVGLAAGQAFDWSIVEEAGKAHGFDLALPLQAGHRWLLIGDHKQLDPYRWENYRDGVEQFDTVVRLLRELKGRAFDLVDQAWIDTWEERTPAERAEFKEFAKEWLKTFKSLFEQCAHATSGEREIITETTPVGASAGKLVGQHRMHPNIGQIISEAYYGRALVNRTIDEDGEPVDRVRHGFTTPAEIRDRAIVWLDVPWCRRDPETKEVGPKDGQSPYTNPMEARALANFLRTLGPSCDYGGKLAVLSPYGRQVNLLSTQLRGVQLPAGLAPRLSLNVAGAERSTFPTHTVDSFQGNQADVVAISLVRNNEEDPGKGIGFLDDAGRMNVLLSRAERLLILVGSWEFFQHQTHNLPIGDTSQPLWPLKKITTLLADWFASGQAALIPADLGERP
ncbi:AAA domain-containing protein [Lentzea sp. CC55]|uniref:AAA domain-containing protein n=1 Tax=Lentzea sp. CC55 TaxID=2884909 RepID=UPI0027E20B40|nr:AAA domain-containing protein [Lentzea sp. CC55]MCG8923207.1 AAA domain-containing protein [Lentzea sp. CC55]